MDRCLCIGPIDAPLQWDARVLSAADVADGAPLQTCKASEFVGEAEPVICACFGVGVDVVRNAINSGAAKTVADIGAILRAGILWGLVCLRGRFGSHLIQRGAILTVACGFQIGRRRGQE